MKSVLQKVERSEKLITNLGGERSRWEESSKGFNI